MKNKALNILFAGLLGFAGLVFSTVGIIKNSSNKDSKVALAWSGNQTPNIGNYYNQITDSMTGATLQSKLKEINPSMNRSYDWSRYKAADEAEGTTNQIISIYTRHNINKNNTVSGSYAWDLWNREHIWTQTAYPNSAQDNHNIFACEGKINQIRSNYPYAEVPHNSSTLQTVFDHDTGCYFYNNTFEPNDAAKGEVARAVMYGVVIYDYTMTQMISYETVLKWHLQHPVTNRDIYRNNTVHSLQGNRNPFVDHPEYACRIWGDTNSATRQLCGGGGGTATVTSVTVSPSTVQLNLTDAKTKTLTATVTGTNSPAQTVTWSSSNSNIVSVSNGTITATAVGTATITATSTVDTTKKGTCSVTVVDGTVPPEPPAPLTLDKTEMKIAVKEQTFLIATVGNEDKITWTIDKEGEKVLHLYKKESVSGEKFYIYSLANGVATLTATSSNGESVSCVITIGTGKVQKAKINTPLVVGLSVGGGTILIAGLVVLIVLLVKKKHA